MFQKREFELDLLAYSIKKPIYLKQHIEKLKDMKFADPMIGLVYDEVIKAIGVYKTVPTESELKRLVNEMMSDKDRYNEFEIELAEEVITECYKRETTEMTGATISSYLVEDDAKKLADELRSLKAEELLNGHDDYMRRLSRLKYYATEDDDLGLNFMSDEGIEYAKGKLHDYNTVSCIETGFPVLDIQLQGGLRKGELAVIMAATNVGKTALLLNFAVNQLKNDKRVVYLVLDNIEGEMISRTVGCLLDTNITQGIDPGIALDEISYAYKDKYKNKFWFKHFNPRELSKSKLERYLDKLETYLYEKDKEDGILPEEQWGKIDCLVIDYMDLMIPESRADEGWVSCEHLAQELKGILKSRDILGLTATQGGTEAMKSDTVKLHMGQGYKSRFNAPDMIFGISQDDTEKSSTPSCFRLGCLKARRAKVNYQIKFLFWKEKQVIREVENAAVYNMSERQMLEGGQREVAKIDHTAMHGIKNKALEEARKRLQERFGGRTPTIAETEIDSGEEERENDGSQET